MVDSGERRFELRQVSQPSQVAIHQALAQSAAQAVPANPRNAGSRQRLVRIARHAKIRQLDLIESADNSFSPRALTRFMGRQVWRAQH